MMRDEAAQVHHLMTRAAAAPTDARGVRQGVSVIGGVLVRAYLVGEVRWFEVDGAGGRLNALEAIDALRTA